MTKQNIQVITDRVHGRDVDNYGLIACSPEQRRQPFMCLMSQVALKRYSVIQLTYSYIAIVLVFRPSSIAKTEVHGLTDAYLPD